MLRFLSEEPRHNNIDNHHISTRNMRKDGNTPLRVVDKHRCCDVHRINEDQPFADSAFAYSGDHLLRDVQKIHPMRRVECENLAMGFHGGGFRFWGGGGFRRGERSVCRFSVFYLIFCIDLVNLLL